MGRRLACSWWLLWVAAWRGLLLRVTSWRGLLLWIASRRGVAGSWGLLRVAGSWRLLRVASSRWKACSRWVAGWGRLLGIAYYKGRERYRSDYMERCRSDYMEQCIVRRVGVSMRRGVR